jgi:hypothetical protein
MALFISRHWFCSLITQPSSAKPRLEKRSQGKNSPADPIRMGTGPAGFWFLFLREMRFYA